MENMENAIYLSQEALVRLQNELEELERVKKPQAIGELRTARGHGDMSENFEFQAAREELRAINKKIAEIKGLLSYAQAVTTVSTDKVDIGTCFNATLISNGVSATNCYELVGYADLDKVTAAINDGKPIPVTIESPFGKAVRDKKVGEGFTYVDANQNQVTGEVTSIVNALENVKESDKTYIR